ncbi:MAG: NAD-dependent epimerase/dehydratase family protein [Gemmatimonadaceae bacterium]
MRIFITGATGYIGRVVVEQAIAEGHSVRGLSGGDEGDPRLNTLGATPVRGELASVDLLSTESAAADAVFHLGFIHDFTRDFSEILQIDKTAVDALSEPLRGTDIQLVITSGTAAVTPDAAGGETTEESPLSEVSLDATAWSRSDTRYERATTACASARFACRRTSTAGAAATSYRC